MPMLESDRFRSQRLFVPALCWVVLTLSIAVPVTLAVFVLHPSTKPPAASKFGFPTRLGTSMTVTTRSST